MDSDRTSPTRFRLAWRWKNSGWTGAGPWLRDSDVVEAWLDVLNRRDGDRIEHWIESERDVSASGLGLGTPQLVG